MFRLATFVALQIALLSVALEPTRAAEYGTADEAKAMLERAVAAVKEDKAKALDMFNKGRRRVQGPRPLRVLRQRLRRHTHSASLPQR